MASTIITKYGSGAPLASDLVRGELAVDTENGRLYTEDSLGAVVEIGLNPGGNLDITGTVTADGLTVDGNIVLNIEGNELQFITSSTPVNKIYTDDTYVSNGLTIEAPNGVALKSDSNYLLLDDTGTNEMVLNVDSGERMRVTATGIDVTGTVTADGLTVDGAASISSASPNISLYETDTVDLNTRFRGQAGVLKLETTTDAAGLVATRIEVDHATGDISFYEDTGTTAKLFWDASAESLGIGTQNPATSLHISQGSPLITLTDSDAAGINSTISGSSGRLTFNADADDYGTGEIIFNQAGTEAMRIDSSGRLGIGKSPTYKLDVLNTSGNVVGAQFTSTATSTSEYGPIIVLTNDPNDTTRYLLAGGSPTVNRFVIYSNGNIQNQNNSYTGISDEKLKENIVDAGSQWDDIKALRVRKYSFKEENASEPTQIGVIAQEVEAAGMSGLVYETADQYTAEDGSFVDTGEVTKTMKYSILYMKAVKALQEAMDRIETLEAKVAALEGAN